MECLSNTRITLPCLLGVLACICFSSSLTVAQTMDGLRISSGFDYSEGDYGSTTDTAILYVPLTATYDVDSWRFRLTVPYIRIRGPGNVVGGGTEGPVVVGPGGGSVTTESGLGDLIGAISYSLSPGSSYLPYVDLTGKVKIPTADKSKRLGTGEFDYTAQVDLFQPIGPVTPYATVGYRVRGDSSSFTLKDGFILAAGLGYRVSDKFTLGAIYDFRQASTSSSEDAQELAPYVTWRVTSDWSVNLYGVVGLSDGSPSSGGGLQLTYHVQ